MRTTVNRRAGHDGPPEKNLKDYMAVIVRGKWIILIVFGVVLIGTILFTKLTPPTYQATCQVLLNSTEQRSTLFADAMRPEGMKNITQNELAILNSRQLADSVAQRLLTLKYLDDGSKRIIPMIQPTQDRPAVGGLAPLIQVSGAVSAAVDFDPVRDSDVIRIMARSKDPVEAALLANTFAESYRDRNIYMSRAKTRSFREFLEAQKAEKRKALDETESSLQNYMQKEGIVSLDDEAKKVIDQLSQLEANRDATDISLKQLQNQLASYQDQLPQQETNVARVVGEANDGYIRQMQEQLAKLEVQRDVTVAQNPSSVGREILNQKVKEIDSQISALRLKLQKRTDEFLRTLSPGQGTGTSDAAGYLKDVKKKIIETQIEVQSLEAKKKAMEEVIQQYEVQFEKIPKKSVALARLQRARLSTEKLYLTLDEKYNEANITERSNFGYIEIIERASVPASPASPKFLINLAIGIVIGLGLGLAVVFIKETFDVRIQTPEELKRQGFNPLTAILNMDNEIARLSGRTRPSPTGKQLDPHLITHSYPFSSVAETYRQLRTNLQFAKAGNTFKTILMTSPTPSEGKSTTISNLAIAFAQAGKKVLLVDADLRRPSIDTAFKLKKGDGLSELLLGKVKTADVARKTEIENLFIITSGAIPANPAEMLGSEKMREFIEEVKKQYEIILFDSSPVLAVTDPSVLSTQTDGSIIVVSAGKTRVQELEQTSELLEGVGGKVIGVVINNFDLHYAYGISYRRAKSGAYGYGSMYYTKKDGEQGAEQLAQHHKS